MGKTEYNVFCFSVFSFLWSSFHVGVFLPPGGELDPASQVSPQGRNTGLPHLCFQSPLALCHRLTVIQSSLCLSFVTCEMGTIILPSGAIVRIELTHIWIDIYIHKFVSRNWLV